jgi:hypothetical protein
MCAGLVERATGCDNRYLGYDGSSAWHLYRGILPNQLPLDTMLPARHGTPIGAAFGPTPGWHAASYVLTSAVPTVLPITEVKVA